MSNERLFGSTHINGKKVKLRIPTTYKFSWVFTFTLALWTALAQAEEFRYRYVSLEDKTPPDFTFFIPSSINDRGVVSGTVFKCGEISCSDARVAIFAKGVITVLQPGLGGPINEGGTIGGGVILDPESFTTQAALFRKDKLELVPPQPDEVSASVFELNDASTALVFSFTLENSTNLLYKNGQSTVLDFGPTVTSPGFLSINNHDIISGTSFNFPDNDFGFRFDPRTGKLMRLDPLSTEPESWALDINNRGDVLGYSFIASGLERIGVWNKKGDFKAYFVEGIPEFPTISNSLLFNDHNLIVITNVSSPASERGNSYLVPKPGTRLNLADLIENLPVGQNLISIFGINNRGDLLGFGDQGSFLLERIDESGPKPSTALISSSSLETERSAIPSSVMDMLVRKHLLPSRALKSNTPQP